MTTTDQPRHADGLPAPASRPAGEGGDTGPLPPDGAPPPADDHSAGDDGDEVRDAKLQNLSKEAGRYRVAAKTEKDRADTAEAALTDAQATIAELRLHNAFLTAAAGRVRDLDAAWKLADHSAATVDDDGTVSPYDEIIADTLLRYPYLAPEDEPLPFAPLPIGSSGRPMNGQRKPTNGLDRRILEGKFPALKQRRT